jgi:tRNA-dihydrouridine synthase B
MDTLVLPDFPAQAAQGPRTPLFKVGHVPVYGDALLAPMDGFSDWPFRSLCSALGSAMSYTEFVKAQFIVRAFEHMGTRFVYEEVERPVVFQIYGDEAGEIIEAALKIQPLRPDIIDINMGCPSRTVANRGAGVGLMRSPHEVERIFSQLSRLLDVPVTGKIRLGWVDQRNYLEIARIVEENGGSLLAVHGRTKEQGYSGLADWDAIAEIKSALKIPVIGNGDVKTVADIGRMKAHTGCDAVMIGRAAVGNPWIFSRLEREQVTHEQVRSMVTQHLERNIAFYGEHKGLVLFRKHAMKYLKLQKLPRILRGQIIMQESPQGFLSVLDQVFEQVRLAEAAG